MPLFILIILLLITGSFLTEVFVLTPLEFFRHLSLPNWLVLSVLVVVLSWCFGE